MNINQIIYFIEIADTGSFNKASKNLYVSQPNLSKAIASLESEFDISLFNRSNQGIMLTDEGKQFLIYAKYMIRNYNDLKRISTASVDNTRFKLKVSVDIVFAFSEIIADIYNSDCYGSIIIDMREFDRGQVILDVADRISEIGFISINKCEKNNWLALIKEENLEYNQIRKSKVCVYVSSKSNLYNNKSITASELNGKLFMHYVTKLSMPYLNQADKKLMKLFTQNKIIGLSDRESIVSLLKTTDSFILAPENTYFKREDIKCIPLNILDEEFSLGWIKKKKESLSPESNNFIDRVKVLLNK